MHLYDRAPLLLGFSIGFGVACTIIVALRCYVRITRKTFQVDDWLMVLTWFFFIPSCVICSVAAYHGFGARISKRPDLIPQLPEAMKWVFVYRYLWLIVTLFVKSSICMSIARYTKFSRWRYVIYSVMGVLVVSTITGFVYTLTWCMPIAENWEHLVLHNPHCGSPRVYNILIQTYSLILIITDWIVALIPVMLLWKLQISWKEKARTSFLLGLGIIASIAIIMRYRALVYLLSRGVDYTYHALEVELWCIIEVGLAIIASSAASLRPLFHCPRCSSAAGSRDSSDSSNPTIRGKAWSSWLGIMTKPNIEGVDSFASAQSSSVRVEESADGINESHGQHCDLENGSVMEEEKRAVEP